MLRMTVTVGLVSQFLPSFTANPNPVTGPLVRNLYSRPVLLLTPQISDLAKEKARERADPLKSYHR